VKRRPLPVLDDLPLSAAAARVAIHRTVKGARDAETCVSSL
jgi:hypothetical protein